MKKATLTLLLSLLALLGFFIASMGLIVIDMASRWGEAPWYVVIIVVAVLFAGAVIYPLAVLLAVRRSVSNPVLGGSGRHNRHISRLASAHRMASAGSIKIAAATDREFVQRFYAQLEEPCNDLLHQEATSLFYHTAISQSGRMDGLVVLRSQLRLVRQVAHLYYPGASKLRLASLYFAVFDTALAPSSQDEIDYASQIGPAIVGASVVGAIPGANLVSSIIADAVVQGSANALAMLRIGMLSRRYFQRGLEGIPFSPADEKAAINIEALKMLQGLVSVTSASLSRSIWEAARDHLRRIPGATMEGIKTALTKSVKGLSAKAVKMSPRKLKPKALP